MNDTKPKNESFTNGLPFVVTERQTKARWGSGFWCRLCGYKFQTGDVVRWIYANGTKDQQTGNFMVCQQCDGPNDQLLAMAKIDFQLAVELRSCWARKFIPERLKAGFKFTHWNENGT